MTKNDSDSAWKDLLDLYLKDCLDYCLPHLSELIDWSKSWESLDKELQAIVKRSAAGRRLVDKLFRVYLKNGQEQWVLIHVEIQAERDDEFPLRMFTYDYRIYDLYQKPIATFAILTDDKKDWRPNSYEVGLAGSFLKSEFLVVKLIDYQDKIGELEVSTNPFASVILIQLEALKNKASPQEQRKQMKFALTRRLYDKNFNKSEITNLYKFIDWLIGLPRSLELEYLNEVYQLEEVKNMPYISTAERIGLEKGMEKEKLIVAKRLLDESVELAFIMKITDLTLAEIQEIQKKN